MTFKIVQTIEKGKPKLSIVPHHWETAGVLFWPKSAGRNTNDDSDNNRPDKSFQHFNCVLKRSQIPSYRAAEEMVCIMQNESDTDDVDRDVSQTKTTMVKKGSSSVKTMNAVPNLMQQIVCIC